MNREIKFRGIYEGLFVYGNLISGEVEGEEFCQIEYSHYNDFRQWDVDPKTVGQYTGLKDKNGVEIYEGDILFDGKEYGVVKWHIRFSGWWIDYHEGAYLSNFIGGETNIYTIAGSTYQNPELLTPTL